MSEARKKFACPQCQRAVKVPVKYLGKRIKCPGCAFVFRAGPKKPSEPEEIYAELDDDFGLPDDAGMMATPLPPISSQPLTPLAPLPASTRPAARPSVAGYQSKVARKPKQSHPEMTEADIQVQSFGIFTLFLPILATMLPLFGVQLRRLARAGDFAPLAAMALGLLGAGCIGYARRNQQDSPWSAIGAAAFVTVTGIGGFVMLVTLSGNGGTERNNNAGFNNAQETQPRFTTERIDEPNVDFAGDPWKPPAATPTTDFAEEIRTRHENHAQEAMDRHRKAMEAMQNQMRQGTDPGFGGMPDFPTPSFGNGPPFGNAPTRSSRGGRSRFGGRGN